MFARRQTVTLATDGSGACTAFSDAVTGRVLAIQYTKGTLDAVTTDVTITGESSGLAILTLTNVTADHTYYPRPLVQDATGADTTLRDFVYLADERVKIVVAQGGASASGSVTLITG